LRNQNINIICF